MNSNLLPENLQPYGDPEQWAALRKALTKPEAEPAEKILRKMNLDERLVELFRTAIAEEAELAATVKAAVGLATKVDAARFEVDILRQTQSTTAEAIRARVVRLQELSAEIHTGMESIAAAKRAEQGLHVLRAWLPDLLGLAPEKMITSNAAPPKTHSIAAGLGIDMFYLRTWQLVGHRDDPPRPRRYTSFAIGK